MSFFYDLNKKLDSIREKPEVTHKQLNERDEGKPGKNFAKIAKDAGERYGSKAAGERVAGAVRNKLKAQGKLEEEGMSRAAKGYEKYGKQGMEALAKAGREGASKKQLDAIRKKYDKYDNTKVNEMWGDPYHDDAKVDAINAANPPKASGTGMKPATPVKHHTYDRKAVASNISGEESAKYDYRGQVEESPMDAVKKIGKRVASGINKLVGHGSDEDMRKDVQRKAGVPATGKKPQQKGLSEELQADDGQFYKNADDFFGQFEADWFDNEVESPDGMEIRGYIDGKNVMAWRFKSPKKIGGWGIYDDSALLEAGTPMTAKQKSFAKLAPPADKITFADKIAGAKKEVDEMLGDVAAEAMRNALGGGKQTVQGMSEDQPTHFEVHYKDNQKGRTAKTKVKGSSAKQAKAAWNDWNSSNTPGRFTFVAVKPVTDEMDEGNAFDYKSPRAVAPKVGSIERGHKHDIKHTATGRMVTRRTDDQGNSVGADDDSDTQAGPRGRGRPKGTKGAIGAKGPSGKSKLMTKEGADQGQAQQIVDDLAELRAAAKQAQRGGEFPQGFASKLEVVLYAAMTLIKNQQPGDAQVREEEKTSTRDDRAEKAGKKVTKDIEYDEKEKDNIHGKKRGPEDAKAEKAGKKVAKDIEHDEKKKEKEVDESTTSGSVATSTATKGSKGSMIGKGIYDSMNFELEQMIAESMSINMSDSTEGNKSLTVTATDDDALKLAVMLKSAGLGGQGRELQGDHSHGEEACDTCGMPNCGCGDVHEAVDENSPDWPTNTETSPDALQYAGGLNKPKTDVAGDGQTTIPNSAVHTQDEDALRRMMEMAGLAEAAKSDFLDLDKDKNKKESMKDAADDKEEDTVEESIRRMMEIAGVKKKPMDEQKTEEGNLFTKGLEDDDVKIGDTIPGTDAIKTKDIGESIFALTNQWRAYKG